MAQTWAVDYHLEQRNLIVRPIVPQERSCMNPDGWCTITFEDLSKAVAFANGIFEGSKA